MENPKRRRVINYKDDAQKQAVLPLDLFCEILARLPVEIILRCKSVCKGWRDMIQTRHFVNLQVHMTANKPPKLILQSQNRADMNSLFLLNPEELMVRKIHLDKIQLRTRFKCHLPALGIRCSCDGLLCMASEERLDPVFICNPITRECVILPVSGSMAHLVSHQLGFGFDRSSGKYKVIREYRTSVNRNVSQFQIIALGESSWRQLSTHDNMLLSHLDAAVFWNGSFHWIIDKTIDEPILAFDLSTEKFYTVPFPAMRTFGDCYELLVLRGSLTLVEHDNHMMKIWQIRGNKVEGFSVHCMEEYDTYVCWNQYHRYSTILQRNYNTFLLQVHVTDNQNVNRDWFKEFAPETAEYFHQDIRDLPDHFRAVHFRPSFLSPIASTLDPKSASAKEHLDMVSSVWRNWVGFRYFTPSIGTLRCLFSGKWKWA